MSRIREFMIVGSLPPKDLEHEKKKKAGLSPWAWGGIAAGGAGALGLVGWLVFRKPKKGGRR